MCVISPQMFQPFFCRSLTSPLPLPRCHNGRRRRLRQSFSASSLLFLSVGSGFCVSVCVYVCAFLCFICVCFSQFDGDLDPTPNHCSCILNSCVCMLLSLHIVSLLLPLPSGFPLSTCKPNSNNSALSAVSFCLNWLSN